MTSDKTEVLFTPQMVVRTGQEHLTTVALSEQFLFSGNIHNDR